ncbi:MAG TPA: hypothetical protein VGV13_20300 [Methylomirabilota bacterium]|jgi:hypothetical protein|nr:hypothetical protein [Methylomirabilota bacterium]
MAVESLVRRRLTPWALLLLTTQALVLTTGCTPSAPAAVQQGTAVVIFIDFSQSIAGDDRASFRREIESQILSSLSAGDRLLIAPIHDRTLTDFRPLLEVILPAKPGFNGFLDNVLKYNRQAKEIEAQVRQLKEKTKADVAQVFAQRFSSLQTDIFSSLLVAQKLFHDESRRKVLVLMSDMIEDSPQYNFERISWSSATIERTLSELDAKGLIPKLPGVCLYVSGASAKSAALAENIGRFWQAYFRRTGADVDPSRYAHVLLHWPPANSCRPTGAPRVI